MSGRIFLFLSLFFSLGLITITIWLNSNHAALIFARYFQYIFLYLLAAASIFFDSEKMKREKKKKQKYWIFIKLEVGIYRSVCVWINRFEVLFRYFFFLSLYVCSILLVIVIDFFDSIYEFFMFVDWIDWNSLYVSKQKNMEISLNSKNTTTITKKYE